MKLPLIAASVVALSISAFSTPTMAKNTEVNPWKHCGIGAMIFEDNTTAAAISNIIWDLGSTAVTSATLSAETCKGQEVKVAQFINSTYDVLVNETAQGEGEHLQTALNLVGCAATPNSIQTLRTGLSNNIATLESAEYADKAYSYYQTLQNVALSCS